MAGRLGRQVYAWTAIILTLSATIFLWHNFLHWQPSALESSGPLSTPLHLRRTLAQHSWNYTAGSNGTLAIFNSSYAQGNATYGRAECGRFADPPGKICPLNVCCSEAGFVSLKESLIVQR